MLQLFQETAAEMKVVQLKEVPRKVEALQAQIKELEQQKQASGAMSLIKSPALIPALMPASETPTIKLTLSLAGAVAQAGVRRI